MALPTQKRTRASKKKRAFHLRIKRLGFSICSKCGRLVLAHKACPFCGTYKNREVVEVKIKKKGEKKKAET